MTVRIVAQSDQAGGAARASWRLYQALRAAGTETSLLVRNKVSDDPRAQGPSGRIAKFVTPLRFHVGLSATRLQKSHNTAFHSINLLPSGWSRTINADGADLHHLHFVAGETMSIADIGRIRRPQVWTLHDMWAFCGAEHYASEGPDERWRVGYRRTNRPPADRGPDLDRWTWNRKRRAWKTARTLITPTRWLADLVGQSALLSEWPVTVIPNTLDTQTFQPLDRRLCRQALGLPQDRTIVLFGALGGSQDPRKGYDLLVSALEAWATSPEAARALGVVFGQGEPANPPPSSVPLRWMGHLHDDVALTLLYNAADVMVVPSRQEAFGQTASEAQACGVPVVAFRSSGLVEVVDDRQTGYLADPFDPSDLARGLSWVLTEGDRRRKLGEAARGRAVRLWSPPIVAQSHLDLYQKVLQESIR